jgi:flavin-binding protein dodecin
MRKGFRPEAAILLAPAPLSTFQRVLAARTGDAMSNHVYKTMELTGSSPSGVEDAVNTAIAKAAETVRNMQWFEVVETRGHIQDGKVAHWQVTLKVGFTLE